MQVGVIGTINRDTISFPDRSRRLGWGGILYNIRTLSEYLDDNDIILPACNVGADCYAPIMLELKRMKNVRADHVRRVEAVNNHCRLTYHDRDNKSEILEGGVPSLNYHAVEPLTRCEYILLNFISGRDITIKSLEKFRQFSNAVIYTDIHSYTLGRRADGSRYLRKPSAWTRLVNCSDYIQLNRTELAVLIRNGYRRIMDNPVEENLESVHDILCESGVNPEGKRFIVTDGAHGCYFASFDGDGVRVKEHTFERVKDGDTTGCGDSFGAGFVAGLRHGKSVDACIRQGQEAARECIVQNERWRNSK